ncbi:MAG: YjbQ family protein [Thaumarchaeota archaeon]|jgi:secondary thiamine-phosphate synthase enzyme|nr:YjbQ family protein [Nitrososphaerota archaeon]|tara:strand:- start:102 stop:521 length:420 start_codon:yes stop_codon:yes gene_type:complete
MNIITKEITIKTKHENQMIDLSDDINSEIKSSGLETGIVTIFTRHSTGAITTIEYEPGLEKDFPAMLKRIAPDDIFYEHENTWHDGNGRSHVKASLIGSSITVPFKDQKLLLGQWQHVIFLECNIEGRDRQIVFQMIGN